MEDIGIGVASYFRRYLDKIEGEMTDICNGEITTTIRTRTIKTKEEPTPLILAVIGDSLEEFESILRTGDPKYFGSEDDNRSALHYTVCLPEQAEKFTRPLLIHGFDPLRRTLDSSRSALHFACATGNVSLVELLLDYVEDKSAVAKCVDVLGRNPMHYVSQGPDTDAWAQIVDLLMIICGESPEFAASDQYGASPLLLAVDDDNQSVVTRLLFYTIFKDKIKQPDVDGRTALFFADGAIAGMIAGAIGASAFVAGAFVAVGIPLMSLAVAGIALRRYKNKQTELNRTGRSLRGTAHFERKFFYEKINEIKAGTFDATKTLTQLWEDNTMNEASVNTLFFCYILGADPTKLESRFRSNNTMFLDFLQDAQYFWSLEHPASSSLLVNKQQPKKIFAVSLDGGGVRGLISSLILRYTTNKIFGEEIDIKNKFQFFIGTSTGGIISLCLNKQVGRTPTDCIKFYWALKNDVFLQANNIWSRIGRTVSKVLTHHWEQPQTNNLLRVLKQEFGEEKFRSCSVDNPYCSSVIPRVCITALNITNTSGDLTCFHNYVTRNGSPMTPLTFWQMAQATSAAPSYFRPALIDENGRVSQYVDGGLGANCPLKALCLQFDSLFSPLEQERKIGAVLSVGTGNPGVRPRPPPRIPSGHTIELLTEQATGGDSFDLRCAEQRFRNQNIHFLRLNPENVDYELDELDDIKLVEMLWATLWYLQDKGAEIDRFAEAYAACQKPIQH